MSVNLFPKAVLFEVSYEKPVSQITSIAPYI